MFDPGAQGGEVGGIVGRTEQGQLGSEQGRVSGRMDAFGGEGKKADATGAGPVDVVSEGPGEVDVFEVVEGGPPPGSEEADQFEVLLLLIEHYEASHYPIAPPDPIEAIRFRMEQAGLTPKDLEPMIGRLNRVYEVLTRKRPLTTHTR